MGTRALTVFKDGRKEIVVLYRQMDGYIENGHGDDLIEFLKNKTIVNGFSGTKQEDFNGMGCLTAQVVAHFKDGIGGFYLHPAGTRDCGEEYIYYVSNNDGKPRIDVDELDGNPIRRLL